LRKELGLERVESPQLVSRYTVLDICCRTKHAKVFDVFVQLGRDSHPKPYLVTANHILGRTSGVLNVSVEKH